MTVSFLPKKAFSIALSLLINLRKIAILATVSLLHCEHGIFLPLLRSSLISLWNALWFSAYRFHTYFVDSISSFWCYCKCYTFKISIANYAWLVYTDTIDFCIFNEFYSEWREYEWFLVLCCCSENHLHNNSSCCSFFIAQPGGFLLLPNLVEGTLHAQIVVKKTKQNNKTRNKKPKAKTKQYVKLSSVLLT